MNEHILPRIFSDLRDHYSYATGLTNFNVPRCEWQYMIVLNELAHAETQIVHRHTSTHVA